MPPCRRPWAQGREYNAPHGDLWKRSVLLPLLQKDKDNRIDTWILPLAIALATLAVFSRSMTCDFVNFDDFDYVASNPKVNRGLSVESFLWALTSKVGANWHPVTVLSHMLDSQIYGVHDAWGHHLTNVLLHAVNAALLFVFLHAMTGARWRSVLVAALFAFHPLHVESVTWVSERKDVLSTFFWFSSLWAYARYVRHPGIGKYLVVALLLALGLMSKPMVVTAPCLMLVLDYWPLRRLFAAASSVRENLARVCILAAEKVPFFLLVATTSIVTFNFQYDRGVRSTDALSVKYRIYNMIASYGEYISQLVWPSKMAVFYPHPNVNILMSRVFIAGFTLLVVTVLALAWWRKRPYFLSGWMWYLGTLVPAIGLVQVGGAARADRYTYVPFVGLFIAIAWGLEELSAGDSRRRRIVATIGGLWIAVLIGLTWIQQGYWKNSFTLFTHTGEVASPEKNFIAHNGLGTAYKLQGDYDAAIAEFDISLRMHPNDHQALLSKALVLQKLQRWEEAGGVFAEVIARGLGGPGERVALGRALFKLERYEEAVEHFRKAVDMPSSPFSLVKSDEHMPRIMWSLSLQALGRFDEAAEVFEEGLERSPDDIYLLAEYAWLQATCPDESIRDRERAVGASRKACVATQNHDIRMLDVHAATLANALRFSEAVRVARQAVDLGQARINALRQEIDTFDWREWEIPPTAIFDELELLVPRVEERLKLYQEANVYRHDAKKGRY